MQAGDFLSLLQHHEFDFFTGVPCSYFSALCRELNKLDRCHHFPAVREDLAIGLAAGAHLAGKKPVVYMQNSGLGYCLEALASLPLIYKIPMLLLVSYRGPADPGMEEHQVLGRHTIGLLKTMRLRYSPLKERNEPDQINRINLHLQRRQLPYLLLIGKGVLS